MVTIHLPVSSWQPMCRFRWWQPEHSGANRDMWALDDVSVTTHMYNTIYLDFEDKQDVSQGLDVHLGRVDEYCGRSNALRYDLFGAAVIIIY